MRCNRNFLLLLSMCLTIFFIALNARSSMDLFEFASVTEKHSSFKKHEESHADYNRWIIHSQIHRYVTPSLAELRDIPYMYKHVLMLTRIPGAGAELIVLILQRLQGYNAFKHIRLPSNDYGFLSAIQQELLVEEVMSIIRQEAIPLTFDGNIKFLNFSAFGHQGPTFISLVRNPLDSRIWQWEGKKNILYHGAIPYFCGQESRCMERNNTWALERAKANVIRWYPVVGILDYMKESLNAFAIEFPYFFNGAINIYNQFQVKENLPTLVTLKLRIKNAFLKKFLAQEVEFYQWLKYRLLNKTFNNGKL